MQRDLINLASLTSIEISVADRYKAALQFAEGLPVTAAKGLTARLDVLAVQINQGSALFVPTLQPEHRSDEPEHPRN